MQHAITRRRFLEGSMLATAVAAGTRLPARTLKVPAADAEPETVRRAITVGVVQQSRERELAANRDQIVRSIGRAKDRGCRLVIFPEDALGSPAGTSNEDIEKAVDAVREAARSSDVHVVFCSSSRSPACPRTAGGSACAWSARTAASTTASTS